MKYLILIALLLAGCGYEVVAPDEYAHALKRCEANDGLAWMATEYRKRDRVWIKSICKNGAIFDERVKTRDYR